MNHDIETQSYREQKEREKQRQIENQNQIGREKKQQKHLGVFNSTQEAFLAYKKYKESYIKKVADKYKGQIKDNVYEALYKWEVEIND